MCAETAEAISVLDVSARSKSFRLVFDVPAPARSVLETDVEKWIRNLCRVIRTVSIGFRAVATATEKTGCVCSLQGGGSSCLFNQMGTNFFGEHWFWNMATPEFIGEVDFRQWAWQV